jgi:hypothetical protein
MAELNKVKLPEDVATAFKYVGNGAVNYVVNGKAVNVEQLTIEQAEALVASGVHFLKAKPKSKKAKATDPK